MLASMAGRGDVLAALLQSIDVDETNDSQAAVSKKGHTALSLAAFRYPSQDHVNCFRAVLEHAAALALADEEAARLSVEEEVAEADHVWEGIMCDGCETEPLCGARFMKQLQNDSFDLCATCFAKLSDPEQAEFQPVEPQLNEVTAQVPIGEAVSSPIAPDVCAFEAGDEAIYTPTGETVTVLVVHFDDAPNTYFTIRMAQGSERQTSAERLIKPSEAHHASQANEDASMAPVLDCTDLSASCIADIQVGLDQEQSAEAEAARVAAEAEAACEAAEAVMRAAREAACEAEAVREEAKAEAVREEAVKAASEAAAVQRAMTEAAKELERRERDAIRMETAKYRALEKAELLAEQTSRKQAKQQAEIREAEQEVKRKAQYAADAKRKGLTPLQVPLCKARSQITPAASLLQHLLACLTAAVQSCRH